MTTQSQPHLQRSETMPPVDKGAAAPEQKPGEIPVDTLRRVGDADDFAAVGGEGSEGPESTEATDTEPAEERPSLEPADADRFAMAFRPSWAPLAGASEAKPAQRIDRAPRAEHTPRVAAITHDEPLTVPGLHRKRRAAIWASASVASFLALAYWGVSSTTKTPHEAALSPVSTAPANASRRASESAPARAPEETAPAASPASPPTTSVGAGTAELSPSGPRLEPVAVPVATELAALARQAETADQANPTPNPTRRSDDPPTQAAATTPKRQERAQATPAQAIAAHGPLAPAARTAPPPAAAANSERAALAARAEATPLHPRNPLLSVRAVPDNVRLWLDGQRMANPFSVRLPRGSKHRIEARGDGYETSAQTVRIESDAKLTIAVKRTPPPPRARAVQAVPSNVRDDRSKPVDKRKRGAGFVVVSPY